MFVSNQNIERSLTLLIFIGCLKRALMYEQSCRFYLGRIRICNSTLDPPLYWPQNSISAFRNFIKKSIRSECFTFLKIRFFSTPPKPSIACPLK